LMHTLAGRTVGAVWDFRLHFFTCAIFFPSFLDIGKILVLKPYLTLLKENISYISVLN